MNLDILYRLQEQLKNTVITGVLLIKEDFRLKKTVEDMESLAKLAPVFAQMERIYLHVRIPESGFWICWPWWMRC